MNAYLRWWRVLVFAGIAVNTVSGLLALLRPQRVQQAMRLEPLEETAWLRLGGLMLLNVSIFSAVTAVSPTRFPLFSHLVSLERLASGLFSLQVASTNPLQSSNRPRAFVPLGVFDTVVSLAGIVLLVLGLRQHRRAEQDGSRSAPPEAGT